MTNVFALYSKFSKKKIQIQFNHKVLNCSFIILFSGQCSSQQKSERSHPMLILAKQTTDQTVQCDLQKPAL